eukprot:CAMPEP_0197324410 /NCGR_PEP_ID=MMETSP0891-20130614/71087_1 /TAXON_ID=44058 ORGANISM="Aureoumbra lagunensis, Strain CCMP1510" /NCGR_SAMPLE_ID=MMETSP0891 /ASSEMBLY_ACC=CAM_ASM_000534 /LENGTH=700 /DNA_ID=CAMNT_0042817215 /DNA_START=553 /DNA_END=2659 /DNA_ORIENTATION=+
MVMVSKKLFIVLIEFDIKLYIDIDIHHGDGVEEAFYCTDRVMTLSLHKFGDFFPGTGDITNTGAGVGNGYAVNIPLKEGINDQAYATIFKPIMNKVIQVFQPGAIVLQCGADSLTGDRLGCFNLTLHGHGECVQFVQSFGLPLLVLGGGGYTIRNVARCWAYETSVLLNTNLNDEIPYNDYFEYYAPDFKLHLTPTPGLDNANSADHLRHLRDICLRNLNALPTIPTVQISVHHPATEDNLAKNRLESAQANADHFDDAQPDAKRQRTDPKTGAQRRLHPAEFYDDDDDRNQASIGMHFDTETNTTQDIISHHVDQATRIDETTSISAPIAMEEEPPIEQPETIIEAGSTKIESNQLPQTIIKQAIETQATESLVNQSSLLAMTQANEQKIPPLEAVNENTEAAFAPPQATEQFHVEQQVQKEHVEMPNKIPHEKPSSIADENFLFFQKAPGPAPDDTQISDKEILAPLQIEELAPRNENNIVAEPELSPTESSAPANIAEPQAPPVTDQPVSIEEPVSLAPVDKPAEPNAVDISLPIDESGTVVQATDIPEPPMLNQFEPLEEIALPPTSTESEDSNLRAPNISAVALPTEVKLSPDETELDAPLESSPSNLAEEKKNEFIVSVQPEEQKESPIELPPLVAAESVQSPSAVEGNSPAPLVSSSLPSEEDVIAVPSVSSSVREEEKHVPPQREQPASSSS